MFPLPTCVVLFVCVAGRVGGECEDKECSTLVDNALSVNSPHVTVCVQCAHTCCTRLCPTLRTLLRGAHLCASSFVAHVGGDLEWWSLDCYLCPRLVVVFTVLLVRCLNSFKRATCETEGDVLWLFCFLCSFIYWVSQVFLIVCFNFNQYKHSTMNTNCADDMFMLWWPIWFQVEREQCAPILVPTPHMSVLIVLCCTVLYLA